MTTATWDNPIQAQTLVRRAICFTFHGQRLRVQIQTLPGLHRLATGSDCVRKTDDSKLITAIEAKERTERRKKRIEAENRKWEERRDQYAANLQAQRDRNGGLTDEEISFKKQAEARKAKAQATMEANAWLTDILAPLAKEKPGFVASIYYELSRGERLACNLPERALEILADIYARQVSGKTARTTEHAAQKQAFEYRIEQMRKEQVNG